MSQLKHVMRMIMCIQEYINVLRRVSNSNCHSAWAMEYVVRVQIILVPVS